MSAVLLPEATSLGAQAGFLQPSRHLSHDRAEHNPSRMPLSLSKAQSIQSNGMGQKEHWTGSQDCWAPGWPLPLRGCGTLGQVGLHLL